MNNPVPSQPTLRVNLWNKHVNYRLQKAEAWFSSPIAQVKNNLLSCGTWVEAEGRGKGSVGGS